MLKHLLTLRSPPLRLLRPPLPRLLPRTLTRHSSTSSPSLLEYSNLKFNSVEINLRDVDMDTFHSHSHSHTHSHSHSHSDLSVFEQQLEATLHSLRREKRNAVFLSVPMSQSALIAPAGRVGFRYHHAEKDMAKLYLWLADVENKVPDYGTHSGEVNTVSVSVCECV
jgi:hypothetical protein